MYQPTLAIGTWNVTPLGMFPLPSIVKVFTVVMWPVESSHPTYAFVFGFEADCGTEPIDSTDGERSSIRSKFLAYLEILKQDMPRRHFGATTFLIPFVTSKRDRMLSMMELLQQVGVLPPLG